MDFEINVDKRGIDLLDRDTEIQKDRGDLYCRKDRKIYTFL